MYILDTNICIYAINKRSADVLRQLQRHSGKTMHLSAITLAELEHGISKSAHAERNRAVLQKFLTPFEIECFDDQAAFHYGDIRSHLERSGKIIGSNDLLIAAHARSMNATLVTNNVAEFSRVPHLKVVNWLKQE